jgi:aminoglycoside/choline kinase family phosphotransferase
VNVRDSVQQWVEKRLAGASLDALAGDASTRTFYRVRPISGNSRILMDYGTRFSGDSDDQKLTAVFLAAGLPVPEILDAAPDPGCLLLEDLGDRMLEDELQAANEQGEVPNLLLDAAELAGRIARDGSSALARSARNDGPALDAERFRFEMEFFVENFVQKHRKITGDHTGLRGLLGELADEAARTPTPVMCHRDYHCRNIMVRSTGSLVLIDVQDARWGPDTYDLVSLIFDAYSNLTDEWIENLIQRYLETVPLPDNTMVRQRIHRVGSQRMIKALGTFGYQVEVVKNTRYLDAIPRTLARLDRLLAINEETKPIHRAFRSIGLF